MSGETSLLFDTEVALLIVRSAERTGFTDLTFLSDCTVGMLLSLLNEAPLLEDITLMCDWFRESLSSRSMCSILRFLMSSVL